jgi:flagellar biosynthesis/type III secretory pathway protein FliH
LEVVVEPVIRTAHVLDEPRLLTIRGRRVDIAPVPASSLAPAIADEPALYGDQHDIAETLSADVGLGAETDPRNDELQDDEAPADECADITEEQREAMLLAQVEAATAAARESGYAEGYETGRQAAEAEFAGRLTALNEIIESAKSALESGIGGVEDVGINIVFEAVAKMLGQAMAREEGVILAVREVIAHAKERNNLVVRVSPDDFLLLERNRSKLLEGGEGNVELVADDRVSLGGCLLEAAGGSLDGRLEVQIQQLRDMLLDVRHRRAEISAEIL